MPPAVCLAMILKDEEHVIARCIERIKPWLDSWVIVDTGSTDKTEAAARAALSGIPGEYHHHEWRGFGDARSRALEIVDHRTAGRPAYAFMVDADDLWGGDLDRSRLTAGAHSVWFTSVDGDVDWSQTRFFRAGLGWRYYGSVHEQPISPRLTPNPIIEGPTLTTANDGGSWREGVEAKARKHIEVLSRDLAKDPTDTHAVFYLAQSYRDAGDHERAAKMYLQRAAMGAGMNAEEIYISFLEAGRAFCRLGAGDMAKQAFLDAHAAYPERREAMRDLGELMIAMAASSPPAGSLFVERMPKLRVIEETTWTGD